MTIFDPASFLDPPNRYRPLQIVHGLDRFLTPPGGDAPAEESDPAGAWTERLSARSTSLSAESLRGIDAALRRIADLGVGGLVTNVGFQDYLVDPEAWEVLRYGLSRAKALGLRAWLYDEKGYPSGAAGGLVTRSHPDLLALGLACYVVQPEAGAELVFPMPPSCRAFVSAVALRDLETATAEDGISLDDHVDAWGALRWTPPEPGWKVLYFAERVMYEGTHAQGNVSEFKHYVNLLEPEVVHAFIGVTHEAYRRELPDDLWSTVEAIFTDEPSLMTFYVPALPERYQGKVPVLDEPLFRDRPPAVPWSRDFLATFRAQKGYDLRPHLYALFFSQSGDAVYARQDYYDLLTRRYTDAFYRQVQAWCRDQSIASSGHVLLEENILDHVAFHGSLFAALRKMDLPGIDMLTSDPRGMIHGGSFMGASFMAVKQAASVAHLTGCERVHSESSDWEQRNAGRYASLDERRGQANVQYALGVNQITSYFGWQEFTEEEQRAYHDYVGRLGTLLVGGEHLCDVAVLYPIRTLWAHYLPPLAPDPSWSDRVTRSRWVARLVEAYPQVVQTLLCHQIDLDVIDETAVVEAEIWDGALRVAGEAYRVVVLPPVDALALETVRALADFCRAGGVLISARAPGDEPSAGIPTFAESPERTPQLREAVAALFGPEGPALRVPVDKLPGVVREAAGAGLVLDRANPDVLVTRRRLEGRHVTFIANNSPDPVTLSPSLRDAGPYTLYRPLTGAVVPVEGAAALRLDLAGYEGIFVVTESIEA
jgi:hypothetical protein